MSWKSSVVAIPLVQQRLAQLEVIVGQQIPGTPAYNQANIRRAYYKLMLSQIEANVGVREAVVGSGKVIASEFNAVSLMNTVVAEAADFLTN